MTQLEIQDVQVLGDLIDIAVKAGGFNVAERAFPVVSKLRVIAQELSQPVAEGEIWPPLAEAAE
jgi:hypothetical protein